MHKKGHSEDQNSHFLLCRQGLLFFLFEVAFSPVFCFFHRFKFFLFLIVFLLTMVALIVTTGFFFVSLFPMSHGKSEGRFLLAPYALMIKFLWSMQVKKRDAKQSVSSLFEKPYPETLYKNSPLPQICKGPDVNFFEISPLHLTLLLSPKESIPCFTKRVLLELQLKKIINH